MKKFEAKTVVITGASRGIGKALTDYFVMEGANVVTISRSAEIVKTDKVFPIVSDIEKCEYIEKILAENNIDVDILINNAGIICYENLEQVTRSQIQEVFNTNVISTVLLSQMIMRRMEQQKKRGVIVNTLSFAATIPSAGSGIYAASKAAMTSLTRTMAAEWAPKGIRVNGYSPGVIETEMTKPAIQNNGENMLDAIALHHFGKVDEMVKVVGFLASEDSEYITGINLDASGGQYIVQNAGNAWKDK